MANPTYQLISTYTATTSPTSIVFSSIPQTFSHLKVVYSARVNVAGWTDGLALTFNSTRTTSQKRLYAQGTSVTTDSAAGDGQGEAGFPNGNTTTASTFSNNELIIPNYTSTNPKAYILDIALENNSATENLVGLFAGYNSTTSPITSITITETSSGVSFMNNSTFYLYGIKNS